MATPYFLFPPFLSHFAIYIPFVPFKQLSAGHSPLFLVFSRRGIILSNLSFAYNGNVCNHELFLGATE